MSYVDFHEILVGCHGNFEAGDRVAVAWDQEDLKDRDIGGIGFVEDSNVPEDHSTAHIRLDMKEDIG